MAAVRQRMVVRARGIEVLRRERDIGSWAVISPGMHFDRRFKHNSDYFLQRSCYSHEKLVTSALKINADHYNDLFLLKYQNTLSIPRSSGTLIISSVSK